MLSYLKISLSTALAALLFHTFWVFLAFWRYSKNQIAKEIFQIVHPGAQYNTLTGYLISDFWIIVYSVTASLVFVFCYNIVSKLFTKK